MTSNHWNVSLPSRHCGARWGACSWPIPFPAKALEDYKGDGVTLEEIANNKEKYPLRVAVVDSLNQIRKLWMQGVGGANLRENLPAGPFDDNFKKQIQKEQADLAFGIASLEATLDKLKAVAEMARVSRSGGKRTTTSRWRL